MMKTILEDGRVSDDMGPGGIGFKGSAAEREMKEYPQAMNETEMAQIVRDLREFWACSNPGGQYENLGFVAADELERLEHELVATKKALFAAQQALLTEGMARNAAEEKEGLPVPSRASQFS